MHATYPDGVEPPPPATAPTVDDPDGDGVFVPAELLAGAVVVSTLWFCVCALGCALGLGCVKIRLSAVWRLRGFAPEADALVGSRRRCCDPDQSGYWQRRVQASLGRTPGAPRYLVLSHRL
jgi:hypothetical protein